jgi:HD-like signal output (HDOD) protein
MDASVLDQLKRSAAIPSMPQVVTRFLEIVQEPDFHYHDVTELLSSDPGAASDILRLANSSLFGVTRKVTALDQAVALLGIKRVRSLVLGRYIVDCIHRSKSKTVDRRYYWQRSLTTAALAAKLADTLAPEHREETFVSGLLADIGIMVLDEAMPEAYRLMAEQYRPGGRVNLAASETALLGSSHAEVSGVVLDHWQLPETVCEAVRHHPWELHDNATPALAKLVGAADRLSKYLCEPDKPIETAVEDCCEIIEPFGLTPATLAGYLDEIEQQIAELSYMLGIHGSSTPSHTRITAQLREALTSTPAAVG